MRFLLLSAVEHQSGSAIRLRGFAGALARRGHETHLLEPFVPGAWPETPSGVRRHPCPRLPGAPGWQAWLWLVHGIVAVVKVRPDVVISLKALPNAWIPARLARHLGARVVLDLDDLDHAYYPAGWVQSFLSRMMRWAAAKADDVTVHTEAMRRLVAEIRGGTSSVYFLDQGIDVTRFLEQPSGTDLLREKLGLGEGPVLLYAGHLGPASDLGPILPSLAPIARAHPDAKLLVVGDGRDRRRLEGLARSSLPEGFVHFAGSVPHAEVPSYYALATVALNYLQAKEANRYRASIKTREALAAGIPVVASRTPDSERFAPFVRFPEGDTPAAFAQAVLSELAVPNRERAARGRAWLLRHGTYDAALAPVVEIWEGLS